MHVRPLVLLATLGIAGCGGGGDSAVRPGPPPPASTYPTVTTLRVTDPLTGSVTAHTTNLVGKQLDFPVAAGSVSGRVAGSPAGIQVLTVNVQGVGGVTFSQDFTAADFSSGPPSGSTWTLLSASKQGSDGSVRTLTISDPASSRLNYTVLGAWGYAANATAARTTDGWLAFGSATRGSDLPLSGTATYSGVMFGRYADGTDLWSVSASANATADFANRSVSLNTSGTQIANLAGTPTLQPASDLNLSGTLSYASGSNALGGTLSTTSGLSGPAAGQFYGPAAAEIGGTFFVSDSADTKQMAGSFGLRQ